MKTEKLLRRFWGMSKECCSGFGSEIVPRLPRGQVIGLIWAGGARVAGKGKHKGICGGQGYQVECCAHESRAWGKRWPGLVVWGSISKDQWKLNQNDVGLWGWQHLLGRCHMQVTFLIKHCGRKWWPGHGFCPRQTGRVVERSVEAHGLKGSFCFASEGRRSSTNLN